MGQHGEEFVLAAVGPLSLDSRRLLAEQLLLPLLLALAVGNILHREEDHGPVAGIIPVDRAGVNLQYPTAKCAEIDVDLVIGQGLAGGGDRPQGRDQVLIHPWPRTELG